MNNETTFTTDNQGDLIIAEADKSIALTDEEQSVFIPQILASESTTPAAAVKELKVPKQQQRAFTRLWYRVKSSPQSFADHASDQSEEEMGNRE